MIVFGVFLCLFTWALNDPHGNNSKLHCYYKFGEVNHEPYVAKDPLSDPMVVDVTEQYLLGLKLAVASFSASICIPLIIVVGLVVFDNWRILGQVQRYSQLLNCLSVITFIFFGYLTFSEAGAVCGGAYLKGQPRKQFEGHYALNAYYVMHGLVMLWLYSIAFTCGCFCLVLCC